MKLCTIVGARPQFIKAAAVSRVISATSGIQEALVHTGQHYDSNMSEQFFTELSIPEPKMNLNIGSGSHAEQTAKMLVAIESMLLKERPDCVLVYGDTNSTLAGALAAVKLHIPVAHVEAGLRSFNRKMPEEINRISTDHISTLLFSPTIHAYQQLLKEGISSDRLFNAGDVMYDATLFYNEYNAGRNTLVDTLGLTPKAYCLATIHRAENTDDETRMRHICEAFIELSDAFEVVLPLHPRTRSALLRFDLLNALKEHIMLLEPVGYLDMLALEQHAHCIITDSGGVQKEAYFNRVPCITLREETEWIELLEAGWNQLCSTKHAFSLSELMHHTQTDFSETHHALYGKGNAAQLIVDRLLNDVT